MTTLKTHPQNIVIKDKDYQLEFDNKAYEFSEFCLQKNIFKIFQELIIEESLDSLNCAELLCAGLLKHHSKEEIEEVRKLLKENKHYLFNNIDFLKLAYVEPLLAPENVPQQNEEGKSAEKKSKTKKK